MKPVIRELFAAPAAGAKTEAGAPCGTVDFIAIPEKPDETAFVTGIMTDAQFHAAAAKLPGMITRIRVR